MINKMKMSFKEVQHLVVDFLVVLIGCIVLAFAITAILEPNQLMTGGITGLSVMLGSLTNINYTFIYYGASLLVLLITYLTLGKYEAGKIVILSILLPTVLLIFNTLDFELKLEDTFLAAFYYGIAAGVGVGLILKKGYSTGGTDTLGKIIHKKKYPYISVNQIITFIDVLIIGSSIIVFDVNVALYAILTQLVVLKTVEAVLYGLAPKQVKLEIISKQEAEISEFILHEIKRGVTKYEVLGAYSKQSRIKVVTICSPRESILIKSFIAEQDEKAFVDVLPIMSVWGEGLGFKKITEEN